MAILGGGGGKRICGSLRTVIFKVLNRQNKTPFSFFLISFWIGFFHFFVFCFMGKKCFFCPYLIDINIARIKRRFLFWVSFFGQIFLQTKRRFILSIEVFDNFFLIPSSAFLFFFEPNDIHPNKFLPGELTNCCPCKM